MRWSRRSTVNSKRARRCAAKPSAWSLLKDRQIVLFCLIYFCIQLTIYAATFWLPSIIKRMGDLSDLQVGFLNSIPWLISILAMYAFAAGSARWKFQQACGRRPGGRGHRHVHVHHRRAGIRLCRRVLCRHRLQVGLVTVLADPAGLPGCSHRGGGDSPGQLGRQPRRLRCPPRSACWSSRPARSRAGCMAWR